MKIIRRVKIFLQQILEGKLLINLNLNQLLKLRFHPKVTYNLKFIVKILSKYF